MGRRHLRVLRPPAVPAGSTATRTLTWSQAGLVAAIVAGAAILGGPAAPAIRRRFRRRTSALIAMAALSALALALMGVYESFWAVIGLIVVWGLMFAASRPIRQAYMNGLIPSRQRATILSFDSLMSLTGGVWAQPVLGPRRRRLGVRVLLRAISALAIPRLALSRRENAAADTIESPGAEPAAEPA